MKSKIKLLVVSLFVAAILSLSLGNIIFSLLLFLSILLIVILHFLNKEVRSKNEINRSLFSLDPTLPRNFDYLVIGDICDLGDLIPKNSSSICFLSPERTIEGSFLILKHVFSLLEENNGTVIFVSKYKNLSSKKITLFDIPFLHPVTINRLGFQKFLKKSRFPLIFSPISSIKFLISPKPMRKIYSDSFSHRKLEDFCKERKISIKIFAFES